MTLSLITDINLNQRDCNSTLNLAGMWSNWTHLLLVNAAMKTVQSYIERKNSYQGELIIEDMYVICRLGGPYSEKL